MEQSNKLDLNSLAKEENIEISIFSSKKEDKEDARLRRTKDYFLFFAALLSTIVGALFSIYVFISNDFTPEHKKYALNAFFGIVGGFLGYMTGKN